MTLHVTHFMRHPRPNTFSIERLYEDVRNATPSDCRVTVWTCLNPSKGVWPRLADIWRARDQQGDVNHVTGDVHYLTFLLHPERTVLTVHDLVLLGRLRGIRRALVHLLWYWLPVRLSRVIVTISQSTRQQLLATVRCDPAKVLVIHDCVSAEFQPVLRQFDELEPRILQIGTGPNKNLERVAAALETIPCRLVIVGELSEVQIATLHRHRIAYENHVGLSREALVEQYSAADLLVFASTYEGFGLPIVEAQSVGRPVVTANLTSMPEVAGGAACLVDPFDVSSIRAGVLRVIGDSAFRQRLVETGFINVERFRADRIAEQYAELYREIAGRRAVA